MKRRDKESNDYWDGYEARKQGVSLDARKPIYWQQGWHRARFEDEGRFDVV